MPEAAARAQVQRRAVVADGGQQRHVQRRRRLDHQLGEPPRACRRAERLGAPQERLADAIAGGAPERAARAQPAGDERVDQRREMRVQRGVRRPRERPLVRALARAAAAQRDPQHRAALDSDEHVGRAQVRHPAPGHHRRRGQRGAVPREQLEQPLAADRRQVGARRKRDVRDEPVERAVVAGELARLVPAVARLRPPGDEQAIAAGPRLGDAGERRIERVSHIRAP